MNNLHNLAVFCGSSTGNNPIYEQQAILLAESLFAHQIGLVYGGGNRGLMGTIASTLHNLGGSVIGVLPKALDRSDVRTKKVEDTLFVVPTMHERKAKMYSLSDAFVALPGGIGTYEEIFEVFTWLQLGYHNKPVALLNAGGFYDTLISFLEHSCKEGFIHEDHLRALIIEDDPQRLIKRLYEFQPQLSDKLS
ncbi:TIGR00730 family Rossman fold protein [uncultured Sphaerochaeta sp.]|uniref:LOG family protein n=1 Tax=uncultured Sphaerochaeta sp. TaxID=886478 RepID=UPI002A0A4443|nr:TIGR00730 family Rossman fold protein [uncultured Sphaerochaeta sp.]